jgi:predicted DNA-binding antitoxin AbrB/MazE fold protein
VRGVSRQLVGANLLRDAIIIVAHIENAVITMLGADVFDLAKLIVSATDSALETYNKTHKILLTVRISLYNWLEGGETMISVQGIYENGVIRLLEPVSVSKPCKVKVIFTETPPEPTEAQEAAIAILGLTEGLTPEEQRLFDEALQRQSWFGQHREFDL